MSFMSTIMILNHASLLPTAQKIEEFASLPDGWHFGQGVAPSRLRIVSAIGIVNEAHAYGFTTDAVPGIDGEIQVICYKQGDRLEFTIETNNSITFTKEHDGIEENSEESLSHFDALSKLKNREGEQCVWLSSSTVAIICQTRADSQAWLFPVPLRTAESQPCQVNA